MATGRLGTHDLHFHYDGAISPAVVRRAFRDSPGLLTTAESLLAETWLTRPLESADSFFRLFERVHQIVTSREVLVSLLKATFEESAAQGLKHLDFRFGCGALSKRIGCSEQEVLGIFREAIGYAGGLGLDVCPTLCFSRHEAFERAEFLAGLVRENRGFIRAIDLEGPESPNETRAFGVIFRKLKAKRLRVTAHAGEFAPARSIWQAIDDCGAERIGHGFSASTDPGLLKRLAADRVAVEVCLSSNYFLGLSRDLTWHPFLKFLEAGVPVVLCTDDPAMFQTSLRGEYAKAREILVAAGVNPDPVLAQIDRNSEEFAFKARVS